MTTVGSGVIAIRVHTTEEFRAFSVAKFAKAVYAVHAFHKQRKKTPQRDIDLARRRSAGLIRSRNKTKEK
jgi:phage-related protein